MDQMGIMRFKDPETQEVKEEYEIVDDKNRSNLANVENGTTASKAYREGDYVIVDGVLYYVKASISKGTAWADIISAGSYLTSITLASYLSSNIVTHPSRKTKLGTITAVGKSVSFWGNYSEILVTIKIGTSYYGFFNFPAIVRYFAAFGMYKYVNVYQSSSKNAELSFRIEDSNLYFDSLISHNGILGGTTFTIDVYGLY